MLLLNHVEWGSDGLVYELDRPLFLNIGDGLCVNDGALRVVRVDGSSEVIATGASRWCRRLSVPSR
jgi:hypothetical protein